MKKLIGLVLVGATTVALASHHQKSGHGHDQHHSAATQTLALDPQIKALLNQEMQMVRKGMESLVFATASADWKAIAEIGHNIKHSYILKQKLTKAQRHQLHTSLPDGFKQLDKKFHYYAGMLAHTAKEHDMELVNYYTYKMKESCSSCHSQYAKDKFPGFAAKNKHESGHH